MELKSLELYPDIYRMKRKGLIVALIGLANECFGVGFMLYGVNKNESLYDIGITIFFVGLIVIAIGLLIIFLNDRNKKI